ncbi:MAG: TIGR00730 family Rossman fold protein [Isosphaeraceae bacterium]
MADAPFSIAVFCGSSTGLGDTYREAARRVGRAIGRDGLGLVYGGGRIGLMGDLADAALEAGAPVLGVIPEPLTAKELAHGGLTELAIVPGMHERKALMATRASAFLMLPGGIGTFEEFFEVLTWAALGIHNKPIGVLNVNGYFDPLLGMLNHAITEKFVRPNHLELILLSDDPEGIVALLPRVEPPPPGPLWVDLAQS